MKRLTYKLPRIIGIKPGASCPGSSIVSRNKAASEFNPTGVGFEPVMPLLSAQDLANLSRTSKELHTCVNKYSANRKN